MVFTISPVGKGDAMTVQQFAVSSEAATQRLQAGFAAYRQRHGCQRIPLADPSSGDKESGRGGPSTEG